MIRSIEPLIKGFRTCVVALGLMAAVATGCSNRQAHTPTPEEQFLFHTIAHSGETLTLISAWYTGSGQNWREIAAANPDLRPNRLRPGNLVKVPRVLLVKEEPLPRSFVDGAMAKLRGAAPEKSAEDSGAVPVAATDPGAPADQNLPVVPVVTPPVVEDAGTVETASAVPSLPDPTTEFTQPVAETTNEPAAVVISSAAAASSAPAETSPPNAAVEAERQKTRDQLLKELLQDY